MKVRPCVSYSIVELMDLHNIGSELQSDSLQWEFVGDDPLCVFSAPVKHII